MDDLVNVAALLEMALKRRGFDGTATILLTPEQFMSFSASLTREMAIVQSGDCATAPNSFRIGSVTFKLDGRRPRSYVESLPSRANDGPSESFKRAMGIDLHSLIHGK